MLGREFAVDKLNVKIFETREEMGKTAGEEIAERIRELLDQKDEINMIFAAAPSQNETLATLIAAEGIDWSRINAFHMDEYIKLAVPDRQSFGMFLKENLFDKVNFKSVSYINGKAGNLDEECVRYGRLLKQYPADIVCMGIGENGHIAFNDPPVADFNDKKLIKIVKLDEICRNQQVNDGCFKTISDVPTHALTLTIPSLMKCRYIFCSVPAATKADAIKRTVYDEISEKCPATILRTHKNAVLYCDADSGKYII
ncbi:MAG: glucosamine-6-phosphate deaminase [Oscillospiraceae bacterium]|nr:glucosamine-6-phosphate deaminase [Oscillospiraceae bacterium]